MKGIVLAGGTGSRLWPSSSVFNKQLMPIYDKPMIYYPISTLMLAGVREILIITTPRDLASYKVLLGDGSDLGIQFSYEIQQSPRGIAEALVIAENFLSDQPCILILGDNIFHGVGLGHELSNTSPVYGAHIFTYEVSNPTDYGILNLDQTGTPISIVEKPSNPTSNLAITGLYFLDNRATGLAKALPPSPRGEIEITSLIECYLESEELSFTKLSRGTAWLDTGTIKGMHDASTYVRVIEERTGLKIACLEEIAFRNGWISAAKIESLISAFPKSEYRSYLSKLIDLKND